MKLTNCTNVAKRMRFFSIFVASEHDDACVHTHAHTHRNMQYLLLFHGNSGFMNVPQSYVICTLPLLVVILENEYIN
jgi:hypothetical protein